MRLPVGIAALSGVLMAGPVFAGQAQNAPAQIAPDPGPPAAQQTMPFPAGAKIAFVDIQRIATESAEGKAANAKIAALQQRKQAEIAEMQKALQAEQQKLESGGSVLHDRARIDLERRIERQGVDLERASQDAQKELQELTQTLQIEFQQRLLPVLSKLGEDKGLQMLFSAADAGVVWADNGLDLTSEAIKAINAQAP